MSADATSEMPARPSKGTVFRREVEALRLATGVRCETCNFYGDHVDSCGLHMRWTTKNDWCMEWQES